jgi:hypothetical protein
MWDCDLGSTGSGREQISRTWEIDNEASSSIKVGNILCQPSDCKIIQEDAAPWS